jgi:hypothetical protein
MIKVKRARLIRAKIHHKVTGLEYLEIRNIGISREATPIISNKNHPARPIWACIDRYSIEFSGSQERLKLKASSSPKKVVVNNQNEAAAIKNACTLYFLLSMLPITFRK